ncbi:MAG: CAP domain-containing protein [Spirochaetaceae bacterium]
MPGSPQAQLADGANAHRVSQGLDRLEWSGSLAALAQAHSDDMHDRGYFSHTTPGGAKFTDRLADAGITYRSAGENIAKDFDSADAVLQAWLASQGHKRNIENATFTHHGVGFNAQGGLWTHLFIGE